MFTHLRPHLYYESVYHVDFASLKEQGIRGVVFDLDNTLVGWNHPTPHDALVHFLQEFHDQGFRSCIVSNNGTERVQSFAKLLGIPAVHRAQKPRSRGLLQALKILGTAPQETAIVGDQVFTDVLGGNLLGLLTVLVVPIPSKEFITTQAVRRVEKLVLNNLHRRGLPQPSEKLYFAQDNREH